MNVFEQSWNAHLSDEFEKPYFKDLSNFVQNEYKAKDIFPNSANIFRALELCPFDAVKVVMLGQDPYHGEGQANGLSFAVGKDVRIPPSLQNIFKEIESDIGPLVRTDGDLTRWAKQGVLLLNATLTVQTGLPGSHQGKGWEVFTDAIIEKLSAKREGIVFMLWGKHAKAKGVHIDREKHLVLEAPHPSPFSAHTGFLGCGHFSAANEYLTSKGEQSINWL